MPAPRPLTAALVVLTTMGLLVLALLLMACAVPGHTLVLKNGTTYPCPQGITLDSHYRCVGEPDGPYWSPREVERIDP